MDSISGPGYGRYFGLLFGGKRMRIVRFFSIFVQKGRPYFGPLFGAVPRVGVSSGNYFLISGRITGPAGGAKIAAASWPLFLANA